MKKLEDIIFGKTSDIATKVVAIAALIYFASIAIKIIF